MHKGLWPCREEQVKSLDGKAEGQLVEMDGGLESLGVPLELGEQLCEPEQCRLDQNVEVWEAEREIRGQELCDRDYELEQQVYHHMEKLA